MVIIQGISCALAELYGALMGDGCLSRYQVKHRKKPAETTLFTGHLINDIDYYYATLQPYLLEEFNVAGCIRKRPSRTCVRFETGAREVFHKFEELGFPVGKKPDSLSMPLAITKDNSLALACVRGIFDTDGSVYPRYSKKYKNHKKPYLNYAVVQFKLKSFAAISQIATILDRNNIKTNAVIFSKKSAILRITDQEQIERFFSVVNPSNKYHLGRYLKIKNAKTAMGP